MVTNIRPALTDRLKKGLDEPDIPMIANGIIPENTCPFCTSRREVQTRYLAGIHKRYDDHLKVIEVPLFPGELKGREQLMQYARYLETAHQPGQTPGGGMV